MRLNRQQIKYLSEEILASVLKPGLMTLTAPASEAAAALERAIVEELMVEDRLNDEVKDILKAYEAEISAGRMDYKTMFDLVKKKLVGERGLVL